MNKVGIIGTGVVGKTLAAGFKKYGYDVMVGSRDASKLSEFAGSYKTGSMSDAAQFGEIIVLAVKGQVAQSALELMGAENIAGKTVIDVCNPIDESKFPFRDGVIEYFTKANSSLMEQLQQAYPSAHFVKAFNSVGNAFMVDPDFGGQKPTMFICGDNESSKNEVARILDQFGWETEDMGTSKAAGAIESLCILWCIPGFRDNRWQHAFKLLKK